MDKIEYKKQISFLLKKIEEMSKPKNCLLCNRKLESTCNSHMVPQFILKEIAEHGMVSYGQSLFNKKHELINTTKGINNAFTFKLICRDCDKIKFAKYEEPDSIVNFDKKNDNEKNIILSEISIKSHLATLYTKVQMFNMCCSLYYDYMDYLKLFNIPTANEIDIKDHESYINHLTANKDNKNLDFLILFNEMLDYKINIATQTLISYIYNINGKRLYNPKDFNNHSKYFYLVIFPYKNKTRIIFYIEKSNKEFVKEVIEEFNKLNNEEKLHFIFISLIIYSEYFYINPKFKEILYNDKKLSKLYTNTDGFFNNWKDCQKIKNFRKYKNYLLKEYNL